jgi:hypothetical protein
VSQEDPPTGHRRRGSAPPESNAVVGSSCETKRPLKLQARDRVEAVLRARESGRSGDGARAGQVAGGGCGVGVQALGDGLVEELPREVRGDAEGLGDLLPARPPRRAARMPISWLSWAFRETTSPRGSSLSAS